MDDCETAFHARPAQPVEPRLRPMNGLLALSERPAGVMAVTPVYALLSRISGSSQVCFGQYLRDLCDDLAATFGGPSGPRLTCVATDAALSMRAVITLGLIADLLITNALVYAFPPGRSGRIAVSFAPGLEAWQLAVEDNGIAMRAGTDPRDHGLMIARLLILRLDARLEIRSDRSEPLHSHHSAPRRGMTRACRSVASGLIQVSAARRRGCYSAELRFSPRKSEYHCVGSIKGPARHAARGHLLTR